MPQKIYFSCFLGTKISESQAYFLISKSAAPEEETHYYDNEALPRFFVVYFVISG